MLNEHIELALREADIHLFAIPVHHDVYRSELERLAGLDVAPEDHERVRREVEAFAREAITQLVVEYRAPENGNGMRWRQARGTLVRNEHGVATHLVGSSADITPLKQSQGETRHLQRRIAQAELEQAAQAERRAEEEAERVEQQQRVRAAEEEARRAVGQLQLATRLSDVTVWSVDLSEGDLARAQAVSVNLGESLGYGPDEVPTDLAASLELLVLPEDRPGLMAEVQAYLDGRGEKFEAEYRVRRKDGSVEWQLCRGVAIRDADGRPTHLTGTSVFVTRIKLVEAELRAINERFEIAMQLIDFRLTEIDLRGAASPAKVTSNGSGNWVAHGLRSMPLAAYFEHLEHVVIPEDLARARAVFESAIRGEIPDAAMECRVRNPAGDGFRWRLGRVKVYRDENGVPQRCISYSHDIQQIKTAEEEARRAAQQLRLATELCGVGVWGYQVEAGDLATAKSLFTIDSTIEELGHDSGQFPRDLSGRMQIALVPEDRTRVYEALQDCLAGRLLQFEMTQKLVQKDGQARWKLVRGIVTRDLVGEPLSLMGTSVDITQLKETQDELQRVKDRLEFALRASNTATWDLETPDGMITGGIPVFDNAREQCGYEAPSDPVLAAQVLSVLLPPGDAERFMANVQAFFDGTERDFEIEQRVLHKDGSERWHLKRGVVERNTGGKVTRFTGTSIDITERKRMERALLDSEERFRRTFENAAVGMILTEVDGTFLEYNRRFCEFLGYSNEELTDRCLFEFMDADEAALHLENQQRVVRAETPAFTRDTRYFRKDGRVVWGNLTLSVIQRHADGTSVHTMGILQDISERKALEVELQRGRETQELAMRGSDISVVVVDFHNGDLDHSQQTFFNLWEPMGVDPATVPADFEGWGRLSIHPEDYDAVVANFRTAAESKQPNWYVEHRFFHADGSLHWRLSRGTILYDAAGNVRRFLATAIDITKLKQIESELSRAREAAEAANRAKDEFLANVSHEIRTPMNAILGMTELALDSASSDHQRQLLSTVRSAAKNLLSLINDLLDFSKIAAGKLTLDRAPFSLRAAVGDTLGALSVRAQRKGLELLCRVQPEVPDALDGDAGRLRQVLMNLLGNAIKFTQRGQVEVEVEAAASFGAAQDVSLVVTVRDTGIGIAPEKQATIFQAFEQGDSSTTRNYGGTGLGLTISAQLAALMNGSISVESALGQGSTFRFTARFARSAHPEVAAASPNRLKSGEGPERSAPLRILVAEDNEFNIALLQELLRRRGHQVEVARDGRSALDLALAPEHACDLMLLDLHMPELDGFQVARAIRDHEQSTNRHLPIIALTARSSAQDRERCIAVGIDDFLSKPIETEELWAAVERLIPRWSPADDRSARVESKLLDPRAILRACDGQASLLDKLLVVFRESLPSHLARVRTALGAGDFGSLREAAHGLAGTVGIFSTVTSDIALTLEDEAVGQDLENSAALVERLVSMCDALLAETATLSFDSLKL